MNLQLLKENLSALSVADENLPAIEQELEFFFNHMPIPHLDLSPPFLARVRVNDSGAVFHTKQELSYNPYPDKVPVGRANYAKQQVFYGALPNKPTKENIKKNVDICQMTALLETTLEHHVKDHTVNRTYLTLSRWSITRPLQVSILPFSVESCRKNADFDELNKIYHEIIEKNWGTDKKIPIDQVYAALEYISDIFCQTENREACYRISGAYFNYIRKAFAQKGMALDGLVYPSACTGAEGMNIVLEKEVADSDALLFDFVAMMAMQRAPDDPKHVGFPQVSDTPIIEKDGCFVFSWIS